MEEASSPSSTIELERWIKRPNISFSSARAACMSIAPYYNIQIMLYDFNADLDEKHSTVENFTHTKDTSAANNRFV